MENLKKKGVSGIRKELLKKMKGNYKCPEFIQFNMKKAETGGCSDMASGIAWCIGNCTAKDTCSRIHICSPEQ